MTMTNIFYDTEFLEDGRTIDLISIGMVAEDGSKYYAVNSDIDKWISGENSLHRRITNHRWLMENVVPHLPLSRGGITKISDSGEKSWSLDRTSMLVKPEWVIANEVRNFLQGFDDIQLWADYCAYDHVVLCQLWGPMIDLPDGIPPWTHDLRMLMQQHGLSNKDIPPYPFYDAPPHNPLADAKELKWRHDYIKQHLT